jgi:hypothetical protein
MSKSKKTKVIKVTDDPSYFTEDPRTHIPANVWGEFVEWQRQLVDKLDDGGTWIIPAVHGAMTFNKKEKSYSVRLEDYDESAPSSIFVRNARMNILPKSIDILADIGYKVSNMVNIDGFLLEPIKAAVERAAKQFGKPTVVNIPTLSADEDFDDPVGVTNAVESVVEAIAETYPDNARARSKVQERMRKEMVRLYHANDKNEKGMISAMNELARRIRTKEIY